MEIVIDMSSKKQTDAVHAWLEVIDSHGPFMSIERMREMIDSAPASAKQTCEFAYLKGVLDGRSINEELGGVL